MVFVFDWDGTMGGHKGVLSEHAINTIKYLHSKNHIVIFATGRGPKDLEEKIEIIKPYISKYIIGCNGAVIYDHQANEIVFKNVISDDELKLCVEYAKDNKFSFGVITDGNGEFYAHSEEVIKNSPHNTEVINMLNDDFCNKYKNRVAIIGIGCQSELNKHYLEVKSRIKNSNVAYSDGHNIQIFPKGLSKMKGINFVLDQINKRSEKIIAFGDAGNDIEMLKHSDIGIAMSHADKEVRNSADFVIDSSNEKSIYNFIKERW